MYNSRTRSPLELSLSCVPVSRVTRVRRGRRAGARRREKCHGYDWIFITRPCSRVESRPGKVAPQKLYYNVAVYLCTIKTYNGTFPSVAWPPCKNCQNFVPRHYEITCPLSSKSVPRSPRRINLDRCADVIKNFIAPRRTDSSSRFLVMCQILWIEFVNHTSFPRVNRVTLDESVETCRHQFREYLNRNEDCPRIFIDRRTTHSTESRRYHGLEDEWVVCRSRLDVSLARLIEKYRGDAPSGQSFCELLTTRSCIRCTRCIHTHMRSSRHILHPTRTRESARWSEHLPVIRFLGLTLLRARVLSFSLSLSLPLFPLEIKFSKIYETINYFEEFGSNYTEIPNDRRWITEDY